VLEDDIDVDPLAVVECVDVRIDDFGALRGSSFALRELWVTRGVVLNGGIFFDSSRASL
jgi:hypothetical protein